MEWNVQKGKQDQWQRERETERERSRTSGNIGCAKRQKVTKLKSWHLIPQTAERLIGLV